MATRKGTKDVETITLTFTLDAPPARKDRVSTDDLRDYVIEDLDGSSYNAGDGDGEPYVVAGITFPDLVGTRVTVETPEPPVGSKVLAFESVWERGKHYWRPLNGSVAERFDHNGMQWSEFLPIGVGNPTYILSYGS